MSLYENLTYNVELPTHDLYVQRRRCSALNLISGQIPLLHVTRLNDIYDGARSLFVVPSVCGTSAIRGTRRGTAGPEKIKIKQNRIAQYVYHKTGCVASMPICSSLSPII